MNWQIALEAPPAEARRHALETIAAIAGRALHDERHGFRNDMAEAFVGTITPMELCGQRKPASPLTRAKALYAARRQRERAFGVYASMLFDPVWDIMLDLFIAHHEGRRVSVSSSCIASCVSPSTALRWIVSLERKNLLVRMPDEKDKRRQFVSLSPGAVSMVEQALVKF